MSPYRGIEPGECSERSTICGRLRAMFVVHAAWVSWIAVFVAEWAAAIDVQVSHPGHGWWIVGIHATFLGVAGWSRAAACGEKPFPEEHMPYVAAMLVHLAALSVALFGLGGGLL